MGILRLTWRYLSFHRLRTAILVICLALTFLLPIYLYLLISAYERSLTNRAENTPLVLGPRGNPFELVLKTLYFTGNDREDARISFAEQLELEALDRGTVIPMHLGYTASDFPVVGTSLDYFKHRELALSQGTLPLVLGDAVLGAVAAETSGLSVGDKLLTDQTSLYNIAAEQPLRMRVAGILAPSDSPDDQAVFVDVKTAWIIAGIGHGHDDLAEAENQNQLLGTDDDGTLIGSAAVAPFREVTPENLESFHFHGEPAALPLTSLIIVPGSDKDRTILKGRYALSESVNLLAPVDVIDALMAIVFKVKRFFDASLLLAAVVTSLFMTLVIILTMRLRQNERATLVRIGGGRLTMVWLQVTELAILLTLGFLTAAILAWVLRAGTGNLLLIGA